MTKPERHRTHHARFTTEERLAFGQRPFISGAQRRFGETSGSNWGSEDRLRPFSRTSSEPAFMPARQKEKLDFFQAEKSDFCLPPLTPQHCNPQPSPSIARKSPWQSRTGFLIAGGRQEPPLEDESPVRRVISRMLPTETPKVSPVKKRQLHGNHSPCRSPGKRLSICVSESPNASRTLAGRRGKPNITLETPAGSETPGPLSRVQDWAKTPGNQDTPQTTVSFSNFLQSAAKVQSNVPDSMTTPHCNAKTPKQLPGGTQKAQKLVRRVITVTSSLSAFGERPKTPATPSLKKGTPSPKRLIEQFRKKLLENHQSVHDAFLKMGAHVSSDSKDQSLTLKEFRKAVRKLKLADVDSTALFEAMDKDNSGEVSWTEFLVALAGISPEALLWELRCRLEAEGVRSDNLSKVWELISQQEEDDKSRRGRSSLRTVAKTAQLLAEADKDPDEKSPERPSRLSRVEWLKFGNSLGLAINETERLFRMIDTDHSGSVELTEMFAALRAVAPDVSLERFVTKVLRRYRTLPEAFQAHAVAGHVGFEQFKALTAEVDVNDKNAVELWEARDIGPVENERSSTDPSEHITQDEFVRQMLAWSPDTALDRLRESLNEQFGSLAQGKKALIQAGMPKTAALTTEIFNAGLRAAGVYHCDAGLILSTVASYRRKGEERGSPSRRSSSVGFAVPRGVTLDEVMVAIRATSRDCSHNDPQLAGSLARVAVGSDLGPYWQQLKALKNDVRRGLDGPENLVKRTESAGELRYGESGDRLCSVVNQAVKQLAVGNAQNLALKGIQRFRSKSKKRNQSQDE